MYKIILSSLIKKFPELIKTVVNKRRPLWFKAVLSILTGFNIYNQNIEAVLILLYLMASKDAAGVIINFRTTIVELINTINTLIIIPTKGLMTYARKIIKRE